MSRPKKNPSLEDENVVMTETTSTDELMAPAPKRRGRPKKSAEDLESNVDSIISDSLKVDASKETTVSETRHTRSHTTSEIVRGQWNNSAAVISPNAKETMTIEIQWTENALATSPGDRNLYESYIASKAPSDEKTEADVEDFADTEIPDKGISVFLKGSFLYDEERERFIDIKDPNINFQLEDEETETYSYTETLSNGSVSEPRSATKVTNVPFYKDYQIKGFFKDSCGLLSRLDDTKSSGIKAYKKVLDGLLEVHPRRIGVSLSDQFIEDDGEETTSAYKEDGSLRICSRPLRAQSPQGERTAIAASEMIPAYSTMKFTLIFPKKYHDAIVEMLNYGSIHGISGWRNAGFGTFRWRELQHDYLPFPEAVTVEG